MSTVDFPIILGHRRGRRWPSFVQSMGRALDLTGAANRRNLAALQRRDWDVLTGDLERVLGDYRSTIETIANSENANVRRAIHGVSGQIDHGEFIEAVRQVFEAQQANQRELLKQQNASSLRLLRALRAASHAADAQVATNDSDNARHEHA